MSIQMYLILPITTTFITTTPPFIMTNGIRYLIIWPSAPPSCNPCDSQLYQRSRSPGEYLLRKWKVPHHYHPEDCHPSRAPRGSIQRLAAYIIHPELHERKYDSCGEVDPFINVVPNEPDSPDYDIHHEDRGKYFPPGTIPEQLKKDMQAAVDAVLPQNLLQRLQSCNSQDEISDLLIRHGQMFDTFIYDKGGRYAKGKLAYWFNCFAASSH